MSAARVVVLSPEELGAIVRDAVQAGLDRSKSEGEVLTRVQAAKLLKVHPAVVTRYTKRGLRGKKLGRDWRFRRSDVLDFIERGGAA